MDNKTVAIVDIEDKQYELQAGRNYLIGRLTQPDNKLDIVLRNENVDPKHALIRVRKDKTILLDLHSKSGTFWNDQRVHGLEDVTLEKSGTLKLGTLVGSVRLCQEVKTIDDRDCSTICSSPQPTSRSDGQFKVSENNLTSTPISSPEPQADAANSKPSEKETSNGSVFRKPSLPARFSCGSNKCTDSFYIPETQYCPQVQLSAHSTNCNKSSDEGVDSMLNSHGDDDNDFSIPETQEAPLCYNNEKAVVYSNPPESSLGSQFRICTQDFNEASYSDDDSDDLVIDIPDSPMSEHRKPSQEILAGADCPTATATDVEGHKERIPESKNDVTDVDKEVQAVQWVGESKKGLDDACAVNDERDEMCTPDLFDLPELAQINEEEINSNDFSKSSENAKEAEKSQTQSSSSKQQAQSAVKPLLKVTELPLFEEDMDLFPTQVFSPKADEKKTNDGKSRFEYVTLSDKENVQPATGATTGLAAVDDTQVLAATQAFDTTELNNRTVRNLLIPPATVTNAVTERGSKGKNIASVIITAEEDNLLPTQVFNKFHDSTSASANVECQNAAEFSLPATAKPSLQGSTEENPEIGEKYTSPATPEENCSTLTKSLSKKVAPMTTLAQSPDVDLLLCTPQIVCDNFKQSESTIKDSFLEKHKNLFDDSDDDGDVLQLITAPKVSHDFDKLLPHLKKIQSSPKRDEVSARIHLYNKSFPESHEQHDYKQQAASRNRDQRHEARDSKRDKLAEDELIDISSNKSGGNKDTALETIPGSDKRQLDKASGRAPMNDEMEHDKRAKSSTKTDKGEAKKDVGPVLINDERGSGKTSTLRSKDDKGENNKGAEAVSKNHKREVEKTSTSVPKSNKRTNDKIAETVGEEDIAENKGVRTALRNDKREVDKPSRPSSRNAKAENEKESKSASRNDKSIAKLKKSESEHKTNAAGSDNGDSVKIMELRKSQRKRKNSDESTSKMEAPALTNDRAKKSKKSKVNEVDKQKNERIKKKAEVEEGRDNNKHTWEKPATRLTRSTSQSECRSKLIAPLPPRRMTRLQSVLLERENLETEMKSSPPVRSTPRGARNFTVKIKKEQNNKQNQLEAITHITADSRPDSIIDLTSVKSNLSSLSSESSSLKATSSKSEHSSHLKKLKVSMTMVDPQLFDNLCQHSTGLWTVAADPAESDILIMDRGNRTYKFLIAMAKGIPIVTSRWLDVVNKHGDIVNIARHMFFDEAFEKRHRFSIIKSTELARKQKLFSGYDFAMTPDVKPVPNELQKIIECAGGSVHDDVSTYRDVPKLYLVSTKNDQKLWHKYRRLTANLRIISSEGVMVSVMRQTVKPLDSNLLA